MLQQHDVENILLGESPARIEVEKYIHIIYTQYIQYILHFVFKGIVHPKINSVIIYKSAPGLTGLKSDL